LSPAEEARTLEELTLAQWPALQTVAYDGWLLRWADGYSKRANSVNPLYPGTRPFAEKVLVCEAHYRALGLPVCCKITPAADPGLDAFLTARGWRRETETVVQTLDLGAWVIPHPGPLPAGEGVSAEWVETYAGMSGISSRDQAVALRMFALVPKPAAFAVLREDGQAIAAGYATCLRGYVGLYHIVSHPARRRQGYGRRLFTSLLAWGKANGAHTAHLAVEADNHAAIALYHQLGFQDRYSYWYRVAPD
jgi:ribosomal protein S18 acetylase RimI-like enzyme